MLIYRVAIEIAFPPLVLGKAFYFDSEEKCDEFIEETRRWDFIEFKHKGVIPVVDSIPEAIAECAQEHELF